MINSYNIASSKLKPLLMSTLIALTTFMTSRSEEGFTGNVNVSFASESFDLGDGAGSRSVEGKRFGIFPTTFEDSFAFDFDAIDVVVIESRSCSFDNILMGTYKVGFMEHPQLFKTVQIIPEQTTQVIMLD